MDFSSLKADFQILIADSEPPEPFDVASYPLQSAVKKFLPRNNILSESLQHLFQRLFKTNIKQSTFRSAAQYT